MSTYTDMQSTKTRTPFIGRNSELKEIKDLLQQPTCRLLTLSGPGGIGKTRLALEVMRTLEWGEERFFVDLQRIDSADGVVQAIADTLNLSLSPNNNQVNQLVTGLIEYEILLVIDNFEHVIEAAGILSELLDAVTTLKILVTSREVLHLHEEHLYTVGGMSIPVDDDLDLTQNDAVQFFTARARQANHQFNLQTEQDSVVQICKLVDGMPLAIELAAAWANILNGRQILQEIERCADFLATNLRNVPTRHRSIRTVFETSWQLLGTKEQDILKKISVFRGGFDFRAAQAVANASLVDLSNLVDKSLLQSATAGRFFMHELIRQYAEEQNDEDELAVVYAQHASYFAEFIEINEPLLRGTQQVTAGNAIEQEFYNIHYAWKWAIYHGDTPKIQQMMFGLAYFCQMRSRTHEGFHLFKKLEDCETISSEVRGQGLVFQGWLLCLLEDIYDGVASIIQGLELTPIIAPLTMPLSAIASHQSLLTEEQDTAMHQLHQNNLQRFRNEDWPRAWTEYSIGRAHHALGELDDSEIWFKRSITSFQTANDRWGTTWTLNSLADIYARTERYAEAIEVLERIRNICEEVGDYLGIEHPTREISRLMIKLGNYEQGRSYLRESLALALSKQTREILITYNLSNIVALLRHERRYIEAVEVLALLINLPIVKRGWWDSHIQKLITRLDELEQQLAPEVFSAAYQRGLELDLRTTAYQLKHDILKPSEEESIHHGNLLFEPLTGRETQVLALIADGQSNQEIADNLTVALGTVKTHTHNIFSKLNVQNRVQAVELAHRLELI